MAYVWVIPYDEFVEEIDDDWVPIQDSADEVNIEDPRVIEWIKENWRWYRKQRSDTNELKRGDIIRFEKQGYRNEGSYVWDGNKIVHLDQETITDQGSIPREFVVTKNEFYPGQWMDALDQGGHCFWLSQELQESIQFTKKGKQWVGSLDLNGQEYRCIYDGSTPPPFKQATFCIQETGEIYVI